MTRRTLGRMAAALLAAPFAAIFAALFTALTASVLDGGARTLPPAYDVLAVVLYAAFEAGAIGLWVLIVEDPAGRP